MAGNKATMYSTNRAASSSAFEAAQRLIPGGVNSPVRAFSAVGSQPPFIESGFGALIQDIDGNQYLDYVGSWGPHILGHAHPAIVSAVQTAAARSTSFGAPTIGETALAARMCDAFPAMDMVRFTNSGTEASMSAIRLARGATGRDLIVKFAGCYHGHIDSLLVSAGSGALTFGAPSSAGVPAAVANQTIVLPFNDLGAVEAVFKAQGTSIACVIVEPVAGNMGVVRPERGYLEGLRAITERFGALLIFDEVMTGFRLAWGGVQNLLSIEPDLTVLGKVIGGGMPLAAFGGRADIMRHLAPLGKVYQAGTLSGNPVAVSAGQASLDTIASDPGFYRRLEVLGARLAFGLQETIDRLELPAYVARYGSMATLFFQKGPVRDLNDAMKSNTDSFARFHSMMLERGVYLPCSQYEAWFVSNAHTFEQIDATIAAANEALTLLQEKP